VACNVEWGLLQIVQKQFPGAELFWNLSACFTDRPCIVNVIQYLVYTGLEHLYHVCKMLGANPIRA
jgi:hypothetical protein